MNICSVSNIDEFFCKIKEAVWCDDFVVELVFDNRKVASFILVCSELSYTITCRCLEASLIVIDQPRENGSAVYIDDILHWFKNHVKCE